MVEDAAPRDRSALQSIVGPFSSRPRLMVGVAVGVVAFILLPLAFPHIETSTRAILSWDLACLLFLALVFLLLRRQDLAALKARVVAEDEGHGIIVALVMIAAAASLWASGLELSRAKDAKGLIQEARVALAVASVALAWMTMQMIFSLHYAHEYYAPDLSTEDEGDVIGGLEFPGGEQPDSWDFLHFAIVIGVASQTADIEFTNKRMRRIGTVHSVVSFVFNTAILALTINLLAGLFG